MAEIIQHSGDAFEFYVDQSFTAALDAAKTACANAPGITAEEAAVTVACAAIAAAKVLGVTNRDLVSSVDALNRDASHDK